MGYDVSGILFYGILVDEEVEEQLRRARDYDDWDIHYQEKTGKPVESSGCTWRSYDDVGVVHQTYVALSGTHFEGHCRPPTEFDPRLLTLPPGADDTLRKFCKVMGIPYSEPKWYLVTVTYRKGWRGND